MSELFDIVSDISEDKKGILKDEEDFKGYSKYMINKAFSQYKDTVIAASYIDRYPNIPNKMHYDFLFGIIQKRKRRGKWAKKQNIDNLTMVMDYYSVNNKVAMDYLKILSKNDLNNIKDRMFIGGTKSDKK